VSVLRWRKRNANPKGEEVNLAVEAEKDRRRQQRVPRTVTLSAARCGGEEKQ